MPAAKRKKEILVILLSLFFCFLVLLLPFLSRSPKYGVGGLVKKPDPSLDLTQNFTKAEVRLDDKQKEAFSKIYPGIELNNLIQLSGTIVEINLQAQTIEVTTNEGKGWIQISSQWHGNVLSREKTTGNYSELTVINIPKGEWPRMVEYLHQAKKVLLMCTDSLCQQSISGHIYLD
jgi:hypothetical protein